MKLVRRVQVGVSAAAVVAVASTALFTIASGQENGGKVAGPASTSAEVSPLPPTATPKARPTLPVPPGLEPAKPPLLLKTLLQRMPQGPMRYSYTGADHTNRYDGQLYSVGSSVSMILEDSQGPTLISVSVEQTAEGPGNFVCPSTEGTLAECWDDKLPDGTRVLLNKNWVYPAAPDTEANRADDKPGPSGRGPKQWSARALRPDGTVVFIDEIASREEKGQPGRDTPILEIAWLRELALDPAWRVWVNTEDNMKAQQEAPGFSYQAAAPDKAADPDKHGSASPSTSTSTSPWPRVPTTRTPVEIPPGPGDVPSSRGSGSGS
ncbi:hypothetical protein [Embleya sp. NBC_00896]|uniref:hypothetical protein n=1 Tax=Embleya sp. NBC_00896 TaxID=2975961 RepID=UPI00386D3B57|nr:hypothetical protein OG928_08780 [Embleya sp. NBC_00896]